MKLDILNSLLITVGNEMTTIFNNSCILAVPSERLVWGADVLQNTISITASKWDALNQGLKYPEIVKIGSNYFLRQNGLLRDVQDGVVHKELAKNQLLQGRSQQYSLGLSALNGNGKYLGEVLQLMSLGGSFAMETVEVYSSAKYIKLIGKEIKTTKVVEAYIRL